MTYDDTLSVSAARDVYFQTTGFRPEYDDRWVELKTGPISLWFPNAKGRIRAVKLHDLHHVATGYETTWTGEAEIAAWELAAGCGTFGWAWLLNASALVVGLFIAPRAVFRAFQRGRASTTLYRLESDLRPELLEQTVGELRRQLHLDASP